MIGRMLKQVQPSAARYAQNVLQNLRAALDLAMNEGLRRASPSRPLVPEIHLSLARNQSRS
jgi:hypothetical protein